MNKNVFHDSSKNRSELKSANRTNFVGFTRICWETSVRMAKQTFLSFTRKKKKSLFIVMQFLNFSIYYITIYNILNAIGNLHM